MANDTVKDLKRIPFSPESEAEIVSLARYLMAFGFIELVRSVAEVLGLLTGGGGSFFGIALSAFLGTSALSAGKAFKMVATSDHADMRWLMEAFHKLRGIFLLQGIFVVLLMAWLACVAGGLVLAVIVSLASRS